MTLEATKEQRELRRTLRSFLAANAAIDTVREAAAAQGGFAAKAWSKLVTEMELSATAIETAHGGVGASFSDVAVALQELGRTLLPVPFLSTAVAASALSACEPSPARDALLSQIVEGAAVALSFSPAQVSVEAADAAPLLNGTAEYVLGCEAASVLLICVDGEDGGLFATELEAAGEVALEPHPTLDQTRPLATVKLTGATATRLGDRAHAAHARDLLAVAAAQESLGGAERCLENTVAYLKERQQFGQPIGSFQALKHRCAEMLVMIERARATAAHAASLIDAGSDQLHVVAPMALALSSETYMRVAAESIQLRGGIGFTWDNDAHLYFKRAKAMQLLHGLPPRLRAEAAARAGVI